MRMIAYEHVDASGVVTAVSHNGSAIELAVFHPDDDPDRARDTTYDKAEALKLVQALMQAIVGAAVVDGWRDGINTQLDADE
jgi:hypothetical protein